MKDSAEDQEIDRQNEIAEAWKKYYGGKNYAVEATEKFDNEELVIPDKYNGMPVTIIKESAFENCQKLKKVTIPDSIISVGARAFKDCENLQEVKMSKEEPTKKQIYYYDKLCKRYNIEKKDVENLSKLDIRDEIERILNENSGTNEVID